MFKQADKQRVLENMKREGDVAMSLNAIHHGRRTPLNLRHRLLMGTRVPLQPESSPSSSPFSGGFCSSDDGLVSYTPLEETKYQTLSTHSRNGLCVDSKSPDSHSWKRINDQKMDELGLSEHFYRMNIRDGQKSCSKMRPLRIESDGPDEFGFGHSSSPCNVVNYRPFEGLNKNACDYGMSQSSLYGASTPFDDGMNSARTTSQQRGGYTMGNSLGPNLCENQCNALYYDLGYNQDRINYIIGRTKEQGSSYNQSEMQLQNTTMSRHCLDNGLYCSQQNGMHSSTDRGITNSKNLMHPKFGSSVHNESLLYHHSGLDERTGVMQESGVPLSLRPKKGARDLDAFSCEDSFIIQERSLKYVANEKSDCLRGQRRNSWNEIALQKLRGKSSKNEARFLPGGICENGQSPKSYFPVLWQPNSSSLSEFQGYIYFFAKDQQGCRFLQRIFEEGTCQDMEIIFKEIIDHISELMMNPFGNYLVQKLLEVCNEEQRMQIVHMVTKEPGELVRISLNTHGTRSVQKLIETLKARQEITLIIKALEPGFLDLIKDLNGNHVVQRCLQCLSNEENKFIFDSAAKFCVDIATHRHGCCVLQRCIAHSTGADQEKLVAQILASGLLLAKDAFGNYVVQYIIELKIPSAAANLVAQFKGKYIHLSTQKFSSHVVEKCLKYIEESRSQIIHELLSLSHFEQLLQDPFANYVIQSALEVTKGSLHVSLVEAVRPHTILRTSPYCKRIFSQNLLK